MIRTSHGLAGTWPTFASGTVIAALLNDAADPALMGPQADAAPYKGAPKLPVLGVRPPACVQITDDALWTVAEASQTVQLGAGIGMVVGRPAVRVTPVQALACVAGYVLCNDGSWPVPNPVHKHYRPGLRWRDRKAHV